MNDISSLLDKYYDRLLVVEAKKSSIEVIKKIVDIKEHSVTGRPSTHYYEVIENKKSQPYYKNMGQDSTYSSYFKEPVVYCILDDTGELIETNSELLLRDCKLLRGITRGDINKKNNHLLDYLSVFEAYENR